MKRLPIRKLLVKRGLCTDLEQADKLLLARRCLVDEKIILNPKAEVLLDANCKILPSEKPVSRARYKLEGALDAFKVLVDGKVCADLGSSTGGFTELLLERGAKQVFAVDTAKGELAWKLRNDDRVHVLEGVNAAKLESLPVPPAIVTVDISLVSLTAILPNVKRLIAEEGILLALIKPQYEVESSEVPEGGVIEDPILHDKACQKISGFAEELGFVVKGLLKSELQGRSGNQEFILYAASASSERS